MLDPNKYRSQFPILANSVYMISNSLGAMPQAVEDSLMEYTHLWKTEGVESWEVWFPKIFEVAGMFAPLINAEPDEIGVVHNITVASAQIASCFDLTQKRNKIILDDMHFTSLQYLWEGLAKYGARVEVIKSDDGIGVPVEKLIAAIDEETLMLPISHVYFRSGYVQDVAEIIKAAHAKGALVFLDSYQACGTVPIDVKKLNVDIFATGVLKWLCGGPGATFLYVRKDILPRLNPAIRGWLGHERPFAFEPTMEYNHGMQRFLTSSPQMPSIYTAIPALKLFREIGIENIRQYSLRQTERIITLADEYGFTVNSPRDEKHRGGAITINVPNAEEASKKLIEKRFFVDYRAGSGIRIAPHFYNTMDEVDATMNELKKITG